MNNWSRLTILVTTVIVGASLAYLPLQTAAEVMAGTMMLAAIILSTQRGKP